MLRRANWSCILRTSIRPKSGAGLQLGLKLPNLAATSYYRQSPNKNVIWTVVPRHSYSTTTNATSGMQPDAAYSCPKCEKLFNSMEIYELHMEKHAKKRAKKDARKEVQKTESTINADIASKRNEIIDSIRSLCHSRGVLVENHYKPKLLVSSNSSTKLKAQEGNGGGKSGSTFDAAPRPCVALRYRKLQTAPSRSTVATPGRLTVVDVLTGEVLISSPVSSPTAQKATQKHKEKKNHVEDTPPKGTQFSSDETNLQGVEDARRKLSEFIDDNTVIVGHSPQLDLELLGLRHLKIVDLAILLSAKMENDMEERVSWKDACVGLLGRNEKGDVKSTLAVRSLILHYVTTDKEKLNRWVREHLEKKKEARDRGRAKRRIHRTAEFQSDSWDRMSREQRQMILRDNNIHPWTEGFGEYF